MQTALIDLLGHPKTRRGGGARRAHGDAFRTLQGLEGDADEALGDACLRESPWGVGLVEDCLHVA